LAMLAAPAPFRPGANTPNGAFSWDEPD